MSVFLNVKPIDIAEAIRSANSKVIYVSPGIDEVIASALIDAAQNIGNGNVTVLLDVSENVLQYGYGNIDGIILLKENGISIKEANGIRICALVYDTEGLIFSPTPLRIEAGRRELSPPNAMRVTSEQVNKLVDAITPPDTNENNQDPEIGVNEVSSSKIEKVQEAIIENPPQNFDLTRKVQVYTTAIEFVEIKLTGCEVQRHTVQIPTELLLGNVDPATMSQLRAGYNIIERNSTLSGGSIRRELKELKNSFTKHLPKYGNVLLKSKKKQFNKAVDSEAVLSRIFGFPMAALYSF